MMTHTHDLPIVFQICCLYRVNSGCRPDIAFFVVPDRLLSAGQLLMVTNNNAHW